MDVSQLQRDVALHPRQEIFPVDHDAQGHRVLWERLGTPGGAWLVLAATGVYHRPRVAELLAAGHRVAVVNPRQVRDFAKALGSRAKTDRLDAHVRALFAEHVPPRTREQLPEKQADRAQLLTRRRPRVELRKPEQHRAAATTLKEAQKSIAKVRQMLTRPSDARDKNGSRSSRPPTSGPRS